VRAPNATEALARYIASTVFRSFVRDEIEIEETDGGARTTFAGVTYYVRDAS